MTVCHPWNPKFVLLSLQAQQRLAQQQPDVPRARASPSSRRRCTMLSMTH